MSPVSLTRDEAVRRAALIRVDSYQVELEVSAAETFSSRSTVRFSCARPGEQSFVELADALEATATLNGRLVPDDSFSGNRILLADLAADNELVVEATLPCVTSGDGMHRYVDPADGACYVSAYCGMDVAQRVFACFDQPDLKATLAVSVLAPQAWTVLGNGRAEVSDEGPDRRRWRFSTTPALSTYLFVMCAGPWHSVTWERTAPARAGDSAPSALTFGWHARRSLADDLDRAAPELRRITDACFDHYTTTFEEPYPFDSYDQALVPGLNWGAMEMPGCITFRDEYLHQGQASAADEEQRAMVIAHEMAHMWFGDLVSLRWWEDAWLSESFADYMGFEVAASRAGFPGAWRDFTVVHKLAGYEADERRSTHPVAPLPDSVVDVDTAFGNFDQISYAKGNSVLRQLVTWLGEETFLRGANIYLTRHRFGNAELDDFLAALDEATDRDVHSWAAGWLRETGFDTLVVRREGEVPVLVREGTRPHRTRVSAYELRGESLSLRQERFVDFGDEPVRCEDWRGLLVLPNSGDHTFARVRTDAESWAGLSGRVSDIEDPDARAVVWASALDMVRCADLPPAALLAMIARHLAREGEASIWEAVVGRTLTRVLPRSFPASTVAVARETLAEVCADTLLAQPALALAATRGLAATTSDADLLAGWLVAGRTGSGIAVGDDLRWRILRRLAELDAIGPDRLRKEASAHPSTQAEAGAARALAAIPSPDAKAEAWARLTASDVPNRIFEATAEGLWVPEQAELLEPYVERYLTDAPAWTAARGQGFALEVGHAFPTHAVDEATLAGLRSALGRQLPTVLRRSWEDRLDDLVQALEVRSLSS